MANRNNELVNRGTIIKWPARLQTGSVEDQGLNEADFPTNPDLPTRVVDSGNAEFDVLLISDGQGNLQKFLFPSKGHFPARGTPLPLGGNHEIPDHINYSDWLAWLMDQIGKQIPDSLKEFGDYPEAILELLGGKPTATNRLHHFHQGGTSDSELLWATTWDIPETKVNEFFARIHGNLGSSDTIVDLEQNGSVVASVTIPANTDWSQLKLTWSYDGATDPDHFEVTLTNEDTSSSVDLSDADLANGGNEANAIPGSDRDYILNKSDLGLDDNTTYRADLKAVGSKGTESSDGSDDETTPDSTYDDADRASTSIDVTISPKDTIRYVANQAGGAEDIEVAAKPV